MKLIVTTIVLALFLGTLPATAQTSQAGAVAIAAAIRPEHGQFELEFFAACVENLTNSGASYKEAAKDCKDYRKVLAKESTRIANEAADATKASRPMIIGGYGGRYGSSYGGRYYSSYDYNYPQRTVATRREIKVRPVAETRREAKERDPAPIRSEPRR